MAGAWVGTSWAAELNMKSANVQVFNPTTLKVMTTIPADKGAHNVTFSRDGKRAFIANVRANKITIIDAVSKKPLGNVPAGTRALQVAVSPDGKTAVMCNPGSGNITLIDVRQKKAVHTMLTRQGAMMAVFSLMASMPMSPMPVTPMCQSWTSKT
jgi:YVTN family beta-propeller protein